MLRTRLTERFGIEHPIMSAPMAHHSGGRLAAAVSKAGALGSFGGINRRPGPGLGAPGDRARARGDPRDRSRSASSARFCPVSWGHFGAALEEKVPGHRAVVRRVRAVARAGEGGRRRRDVPGADPRGAARTAVAGGADILVAQGNEAGGHTGQMNLLPLLVSVIERFPDVPVLAAGGIASGRALAAVLGAGADGAWVGTAFVATGESVSRSMTSTNA